LKEKIKKEKGNMKKYFHFFILFNGFNINMMWWIKWR
jgi:hypothetical protein